MPELPDIVVYVERLTTLVVGHTLEAVRIGQPFLLRTVEPSIADCLTKRARTVERLGKRVVIGLDDDLFLVIHLMIAGRLHWKEKGAALPGRLGQAAFDFDSGTLLFTEAGTKRRASLYVVRGRAALAAHNRGGLEVLDNDVNAFDQALKRERHTLKRTLTDPRLFSGIGNAYSDEIFFRAQLSPVAMSTSLTPDEVERLYRATRDELLEWTERLRLDDSAPLPAKVTAFRPEMAVHGRHGLPCPRCGAPIQRIAYADNETNYCAPCQTGGKLLADRGLSRLLKEDWPRSLDELEEMRTAHRGSTSVEKPTPPVRDPHKSSFGRSLALPGRAAPMVPRVAEAAPEVLSPASATETPLAAGQPTRPRKPKPKAAVTPAEPAPRTTASPEILQRVARKTSR